MRFRDSAFSNRVESGSFPWLFKVCRSCKHCKLQFPAWSFSLSQQLWFIRKETMRPVWVMLHMRDWIDCDEILHNCICFPGICLNRWRLLCFLEINLSDAFFLLLNSSSPSTKPWARPRAGARTEQRIYTDLHHEERTRERWSSGRDHQECFLPSAVVWWWSFASFIQGWRHIHSCRFHVLKPIRNSARNCLPLLLENWSQSLRFLISKDVQKCDMSVIYILYMRWIKLNWYKFFGRHSTLYFTSGRNVLRSNFLIQIWETLAMIW